jgi:hypothetical protein
MKSKLEFGLRFVELPAPGARLSTTNLTLSSDNRNFLFASNLDPALQHKIIARYMSEFYHRSFSTRKNMVVEQKTSNMDDGLLQACLPHRLLRGGDLSSKAP